MGTRTIVMGRVGIMRMRIEAFLVCSVLAQAGCISLHASKPVVGIARVDPADATLLDIDVTNREDTNITVCMTDALAFGTTDHAGLAPFYLERFAQGKWHAMIDSDVAWRFTTTMKAGEQDPFKIAVPPEGTYRAVFGYVTGVEAKECRSMLDLKYRRAVSPPFTSYRKTQQ
jgi:hypothetical protein